MAGAPTGGAELFFERLTAALHGAGDPVLPLIRRNPARAARLRAAGLDPAEFRFGGPLDWTTRPGLRRALNRWKPDLVMAWMGRAAALTPRGDYTLVGRLGGPYDLRRFRRCDHLVANTKGLVRWIEAQGWPATRVHHLPNFVPDLSGAIPAILPTPPGAPVVLALGRLHRNKAFDILVRALPHLPGVHAVIAGEGPERDNLLDLARREHVSDRLHLLGWRTDTAALLAAAKILTVPSRHEPLGNVILEAFSAGIPVVAAESAGPLETIRPGETGLLVPLEDPVGLADAVRSIIGDGAIAEGLATAARAEFLARHAEMPVLALWRAAMGALPSGPVSPGAHTGG